MDHLKSSQIEMLQVILNGINSIFLSLNQNGASDCHLIYVKERQFDAQNQGPLNTWTSQAGSRITTGGLETVHNFGAP